MYLFIAIIFIAELIIALTVITFIVKADKWVCEFNERVLSAKPLIEKTLGVLKSIVSNLQGAVKNTFEIVKRKKEQFILKMIVALVMFISIRTFKGKYRKAGAFLELVLVIKDYWDTLAV